MLASLRRSRRTRAPRTTLVAAAALALGLAACDDGGEVAEDDTPEVDAPADDAPEDDVPPETPEEQPDEVGFEDLEDGEVVPGVYLEVPVDDTFPVQAQPTPFGSSYVAALTDQTGAVSLNVEFEGQSLDELLAGIDQLVETGQAEIAEGPDEVEVEGADEAVRVEIAAAEGGASATGIFAVADGNAISLAVEVTEDSDVDVEAIIDSLRIDPDRLQMAGTADLPDGAAPDGAMEPGADEELAPEDEADQGAATDDPADDDGDAGEDG